MNIRTMSCIYNRFNGNASYWKYLSWWFANVHIDKAKQKVSDGLTTTATASTTSIKTQWLTSCPKIKFHHKCNFSVQ